MNISEYAYVYARIRARMGDILSEGRLRALIDAENKDDLLALLIDSPYKGKLTRLTSKDLKNIESALKEELIDQYLMVIRSTKGEIRDIFVEILRKFEVKNLKTIIRAKTVATVSGESPLFFPVESFFGRKLSNLMEAESIEGVVKLLEDPYKEALEDVFPEYEKSKKVLILENALNNEIFGAIWERTEGLRAEDREIVRRIIGTEFDMANIMTLLRCKSERIEEKEIRSFLSPYAYAFDFDSAKAKAAMSAETVDSAIRSLPSPYKEELEKAIPSYQEGRQLLTFEYALTKFLLKTIKNTLKTYPINIGTIIGFLYLKEMEIKNLSAIAVYKENEIPAEEITKIIIA